MFVVEYNKQPLLPCFLNLLLQVENQMSTYNPQGYMVVYAVDDESSVDVAEQILAYLKSEDIIETQAVILVANKIDLVRSREISSNGKKQKMEINDFLISFNFIIKNLTIYVIIISYYS